MAVDAGFLLEDARLARLAAFSVDRVVVNLPDRDASTDRTPSKGSWVQRAARLAIRMHVAVQLRFWRFAYRMSLREVGSGCVFGAGLLIQGHERISVGRDVRINDYAFLQCGGDSELIIEDEVTISIGARIMTGQYAVGPDGHDRSVHVYETVVIEKGVWIGTNAVVLPGVRIGAGSIVAAGSVVTSDVPPGVVVAGSPATIIRRHEDFVSPGSSLSYLRASSGS